MSEPTTLRALSGLPLTPASLADSTLIMIDCQNTYVRGVMALARVAAALDDAAELPERARSAGIPIIHPDGCLQPRPKPQWNAGRPGRL
jgi:hypothetical protein